MPTLNRRDVLQAGVACAVPSGLAMLFSGCGPTDTDAASQTDSDTEESDRGATGATPPSAGTAMKVQYLEIVTPDAEALCEQYATLHGVTFGEAETDLGGARTAKLEGGTLIGVRAPMHDQEKPVVRPYVLVEDIEAAVKAAAEAGGVVAVPPMKLGEHGTCAIYFLGGIECGLWQV